MRLHTASKLALADACPVSHRLDWVEGDSSEHADRGTSIHYAVLERVPVVGIDAAVADLPPEQARVVRAVAETPAVAPLLQPAAASYEVALAWSPATGRARVLGTGRASYAHAEPGEMVGTADIVALTDDRVIVPDLKAGALAVPHPARNLQLRWLSLAAARAFGRDAATASVIYARADEDAVVLSADFDCLDLETIAEQMLDVLARVASAAIAEAATYRRGEHCTWCPARSGCPAWVGMVRSVLRDLPGFQGQVGQAVSMGAVAAAYQMVVEGRKALGVLESEIRRLAYGTPLPLGEGRYLAYAAGNERVADPEKVHEVLLRVTTPEVAQAAVTAVVSATSSKGQIEKALKKLPPKEREPVWAELRKSGALARKADVREVDDAAEILAPPPMEARG